MKRHTILIVVLLVFVAVVSPLSPAVSAHFTLGHLQGSSRWRSDDFDPHVPGPLGYVWPGAGLSTYLGQPTGLPPGYQSPYPGGNPPGAPSSWYQLEGNSYSPFGAILTSTSDRNNVGDLIFAMNFSDPLALAPPAVVGFYRWYIYIPPEFTGISARSVVTSITNDYGDIAVYSGGFNDPFGPGWRIIRITTRAPYTIVFTAAHNYDEWYYVRVNGVRAPTIAGRYFFKMFLVPSGKTLATYPTDYSASIYTMPVQNWPVLLVKGDVDPAIVHGTIRFGSWNSSLYSLPITLPGRVRAVGIANNPDTGKPTGRKVEARAYFNSTAMGHYELEGLAPGVYDIYASAAGYPEQEIATHLVLLKGQSLDLDGYLNPGAVIYGQVYSKGNSGEQPWTGIRPIRIELYKASNYTSANLVAFSPWNMTSEPAGLMDYDYGARMSYDWVQGSMPNPQRVALDWKNGVDYYSNEFSGVACGTSGVGGSPVGFDPCGRHNGVGPAQYWWVDPSGAFTNGGGADSFIYKFGVKGLYGAPRDFDGHVPQALATWTNGLSAGTYFVRAYVTDYVQTLNDGSTFADYSFQVADKEWAGDIFLPMDLRVGGVVEKTIWFNDLNGTLAPSSIPSARRVAVELRDSSNRLVAFNFTLVPAGRTNVTVLLEGLGMEGYLAGTKYSLYGYRGFGYQDYGIPTGNYQLYVYVRGYIQYQPEEVTVRAGGGVLDVSDHVYRGAIFSIAVFLGNGVWKYPGDPVYVDLNGATMLGNQTLTVSFTQSATKGLLGPTNYDGPEYSDTDTVSGSKSGGYREGTYSLNTFAYGYVQLGNYSIYVVPGAISDVHIEVIEGAIIVLTLKFLKENIFDHVPYNMSLRLRVFNQNGEMVGAYITTPNTFAGTGFVDSSGKRLWYVPSSTEQMDIRIAGIPYYTDAVFGDFSGRPRGIVGSPDYTGEWTIEVDTVNWYRPQQYYPPVPGLLMGESFHIIPGHPANIYGWTGQRVTLKQNYLGPFAQREVWRVPNTHMGGGEGESGGEVSVIFGLQLNGYLSGTVYGSTWSGELRTLSWVGVQAAGNQSTFKASSVDGFYEMYLPAGKYNVSATEWQTNKGHNSATVSVTVGSGAFLQGLDFTLERSGIPIPETSAATLTLLAAIAATLIVIGTRKHSSRRAAQEPTR
jgi:hypothetical protein